MKKTGRSADATPPSPLSPPSTAPPQSTSPRQLPVRHSRKKLPPVCTDPIQLHDLTQEVFEAPVGSLFRYEGKNESAAAWLNADSTVQKVEYLLRGHSFSLYGTQWNRWITSVENETDNPDDALVTMQALVDRMWEEGHTYMTMRSSRMEELYGPKMEGVNHEELSGEKDGIEVQRLAPGELLEDDEMEEDDEISRQEDHETEVFDTLEDLQDDIAKFASEEGLAYDRSLGADGYEHVDEDEETKDDYMNDFAFPGPTVAMYSSVLDAMACEPSSDSSNPQSATFLLQDILLRHNLDGGDSKNSNVHTLPTVLPFNAAIRVASSQPYDMSSKQLANLQLRDESLGLAFSAFDLLGRSSVVDQNSATYNYLMQLIRNFFPASRIRGNIASGMFLHASQQGVIDDSVVTSFLAANKPSNGEEFDAWIHSHSLCEKASLPNRWKYLSRSRRYHPRESTY